MCNIHQVIRCTRLTMTCTAKFKKRQQMPLYLTQLPCLVGFFTGIQLSLVDGRTNMSQLSSECILYIQIISAGWDESVHKWRWIEIKFLENTDRTGPSKVLFRLTGLDVSLTCSRLPLVKNTKMLDNYSSLRFQSLNQIKYVNIESETYRRRNELSGIE